MIVGFLVFLRGHTGAEPNRSGPLVVSESFTHREATIGDLKGRAASLQASMGRSRTGHGSDRDRP